MEFLSEAVSKGVRERRFAHDTGRGAVPGLFWTPEEGRARGLVLMGHGYTLDKRTPYLLSLARRLVRHHGIAAMAIDAPGHGDRPAVDGVDGAVGDLAIDGMVADWRSVLDAALSRPEVGEVPVAYWGLSLGTILGLPFVAGEPRVRAAVLGLAPLAGPWAARHRADAPKIRVPVLFFRQMDDELFPADGVEELFLALGSGDKELRSNPGSHAFVPVDEFGVSEAFLARHLVGSEVGTGSGHPGA